MDVVKTLSNLPCLWKVLPEHIPNSVDNPNILGNFLLFVGQDQLGENYRTYSQSWGSKNTLGRKYALHIRDVYLGQIEA